MRPSTFVKGIGLLGDNAGDFCANTAPLTKRALKKISVVTCFFICTSPRVDLNRFTRFEAVSHPRRTATLLNRLAEACWAKTYRACLLWCGSPEEADWCCLLPLPLEHARWRCSDQ